MSKFNKGKQDLENLIKTSKPSGNRNGIGFKNSSKQKGNNAKNISYIKTRSFSKSKLNIKNMKIWIPKTNNNLIRQKHINNFVENVVYNKNYIHKVPNLLGYGYLLLLTSRTITKYIGTN